MRDEINVITGERTGYPDAPVIELAEDQLFGERLASMTAQYNAKLSTIRDQIVTAISSDGTGMDTRLSALRTKYSEIGTEYSTALNNLFAED